MRTVTPAQLGIVGLFSVVALGAAAVGLSGAALATPPADPPGNNGTVKVDGVAFDTNSDNEPHVGCTFQIDWYGFDKSADYFSTVTFEAQAPTKLPGQDQVLYTDSVFVGEDDASGGGSPEGLDAEKSYTLDVSALTPHPEQGYHVKLTIETPSSNGAVTKYKVFWIDGCETPTPTTTSPTTTTTTPSTTTTTTAVSTPPSTSTTTSPSSTTSTTTPPTPCESESEDDDCGVVTTPPVFAG